MKTLTIRYIGATAVSLALFLLLLFSRGCTRSLVYAPLQAISPLDDPSSGDVTRVIDDIWFDALGRLIVLSHTGHDVYLQKQNPQGTTIPNAGWRLSLTEPEERDIETELRYSPKTLEPVPNRSREAFFAVSPDTKRVAWIVDDRLRARDLSESTPKDIADLNVAAQDATARIAAARRIAFAGDQIVALVREDGTFELWNLAGACSGAGCKGTFGNQFGSARSLWPIDSGIVVASPQNLHITKIKNADWAEVAGAIVADLRISALSVSRDGRIAVGTHDGIAVLISGADLKTRTAFRLPMAQRIDKVAVFGEGLLAAGDFPGVYAIGGNSTNLAIPFEDKVDFLAASPSRIVLASQGRLWLSEVTISRKPNPLFDRIVSLFSLYLAVLVAIFGFHTTLAQEKRGRPEP